jgi:hypothetical protein
MLKCKVFSTTMVVDRQKLGEKITEWIRANRAMVERIEIVQSSDDAFHCVSVVAFWAAAMNGGGIRRNGVVYDALDIYSATKARERDSMGDGIMLAPGDDVQVIQSSDAEYHCLTIAVFRGGAR